ncbi:MAG: M48 family metalloprotease [Planctomycetaceae bacterium]
MAIAVKCSACGAAFAVKEELAGKRIRCVKCKEILQVPNGPSPAVSPAQNREIRRQEPSPSSGSETATSTSTSAAKSEQPSSLKDRTPAVAPVESAASPQVQPAPAIRRARRLTPEERAEAVVTVAASSNAEPTVRARVVRGPQDMQAESVRHTAATLSAPPEDFDTLRTKVFASFTSPAIQPVPIAGSYRAGIALTSLFMVMLPIVYLAMILGVGWLIYYHATHHTGMMSAAASSTSGRNSGRAAIFAFLAYLTPIIAGVVLILFMLKPLFSKPGKDSGRHTLKPEEDPLLFEFVDRICKAVGSPRPRRIDIDCNINASASFGRGLLSMVGHDLVLTIGMPLVAGLTMRQFAGVLAHEFGHFTQGAGMRLSYLIRSISMWFTRVVYERDAWDDRLAEWSHSIDIRIGWVLYLTRLCVWLTRKVLWVLMMAGHLISGYLLRQMEFDADRHEARLAGSRTFATTARQLAVLNVAYRGAISDLGGFYAEGRLGDNLPKLILLNVDQLPEKVHAKIDEMILQSKTGLFDSHPADTERMASAAKENTDGIFHLRLPAAHLFRRFDFLSRAVTWDFYKEIFGKELKKSDIHPVDDLMERLKVQQAAWKALRRFFRDQISWYRALSIPNDAWESAPDISTALLHLKRHRAKMLNLADGYGAAWKIYDEADTRLIEIGLAEALMRVGIQSVRTLRC